MEHILKMRAYTRLNLLYDGGKYKELYKSIKSNDPLMFPGYKEKLVKLEETTNLDEAVVCATGRIDGRKIVVCVMDSRFLMGSMSGAVGERLLEQLNMRQNANVQSLFLQLLGELECKRELFH